MIKFIVSVLFFITANIQFTNAQTIWLTYGQSKFLYTPGIETDLEINNKINLQTGVSVFFQNVDTLSVIAVKHKSSFNFYNFNLGLNYNFKLRNNHKLSPYFGILVYYAPEYDFLYNSEIYGNIYYDSSKLIPEFSLDTGFSYTYKSFSLLLKFETKRNKVRIGLGYRI